MGAELSALLHSNHPTSKGFIRTKQRRGNELSQFLSHPLQDYLDSYAISYAVFLGAKDKCKSVGIKASTPRDSFRKNPEKISELMSTLAGLELEKNITRKLYTIAISTK